MTVESPKKQVTFNLDEELGSEPTLPTGITLFLSEGEAVKQYTIPTPTTTGSVDTLQPDCGEVPQWSSTPTGGARPKVQSTAIQLPSRQEGLGSVSHPTGGSRRKCWRSLHTLVENHDAQQQDDNVLSHPTWEPQWVQSPLLSLLAGCSIPVTLGPKGKLQDGGPLYLLLPGFTSKTTCLSPLPPTSDNEAAEDYVLS